MLLSFPILKVESDRSFNVRSIGHAFGEATRQLMPGVKSQRNAFSCIELSDDLTVMFPMS
jgi:hypothetical protein